jgi:hypothetical protein
MTGGCEASRGAGGTKKVEADEASNDKARKSASGFIEPKLWLSCVCVTGSET